MSWKVPGWSFSLIIGATLSFSGPSLAGNTVKLEASAQQQTLEVVSDGAIVLESAEPFGEVFIANSRIADVSTISDKTIYVLGKEPGRTTLILTRADTTIISSVDIRVAPDVTELRRRLSFVLPNETIDVLSANEGLVLSGTVSSPEAVQKALDLAAHYSQGNVSNLLNVREPERAPEPVVEVAVVKAEPVVEIVDPVLVEAQIREILPEEPVKVHELNGTIVLSGSVSSQEKAKQALQVARLIADGAEVSNLMTVAENKSCNVRMRRGGELIETAIPCRQKS